jgi:hypothetical protein
MTKRTHTIEEENCANRRPAVISTLDEKAGDRRAEHWFGDMDAFIDDLIGKAGQVH